MINKALFMSKVVAAGFTQQSLAKRMSKCSKNALNAKVNNKTQMNVLEVKEICDILNITDASEMSAIFLGQ